MHRIEVFLFQRWNMKGVWKVLCCLTVVLFFFTGCALASVEDTAIPLTVNAFSTATISNGGDFAYFSFTPTTTGNYVWYSSTDQDTYGYLYDANENMLSSNDDSGENTNFKIIYELIAGEKYYFGARYYHSSNTGSFDVVLKEYQGLTTAEAVESRVGVAANQTATLEVRAETTDGSSLSYRWMTGGVEIAGVTSNVHMTGAITQSTYYNCTVQDTYGNSTNVSFNVYVDNELQAHAADGTSFSVAPGGSVTLTVNASCLDGQIFYTWNSYTENEGWKTIDGADTNSFTIPSVLAKTRYQCHVWDEFDNHNYVYFNVSVDNQLKAEAAGDKRTFFADLGSQVTLTVNASCLDGQIYYQWESYNSRDELYIINDAVTDTLVVQSAQTRSVYHCRISDDYGNTRTISFYIYIDNGLMATFDCPYDVWVDYGHSFIVEVQAICNNGNLHYDWTYDGESAGTATGAVFTIPNVTKKTYLRCKISDDYGNTAYDSVVISVKNELEMHPVVTVNGIVAEKSEDTFLVPANASIEICMNASCDSGNILYRWNGSDMWDEQDTYIISNLSESLYMSGNAKDEFGNEISEHFHFAIDNELTLNRTSDAFVQVTEGTNVTLKVKGSVKAGMISYSWRELSGEWEDGGDSLSFIAERSGQYSCKAVDNYGNSAYCEFFIKVGTGNTLSVDQALTVTITQEHQRNYLTFTPSVTDFYVLRYIGTKYLNYTFVYDTEWNMLAGEGDEGSCELRYGMELTKGKTYIIEMTYGGIEPDSFEVVISKYDAETVDEYEFEKCYFLSAGQSAEFPFGTGSLISDNPSVVQISGNTITALKKGKARISDSTDDYNSGIVINVVSGSVLTMPSALTKIESAAFAGDTSLDFVELNDNISEIGNFAFGETSAWQIIIPSKTTRIAASALYNCYTTTILCQKDSLAEEFAQRNDLPYLYIK